MPFMHVSNVDAFHVRTRSCFEASQTEVGSREGQSIRRILLLIRAISQCHNYQCHQLVCNNFFWCILGQTDALCESLCV